MSFFHNPFASDTLLLKVREVLDSRQREKELLRGDTETKCERLSLELSYFFVYK